MIEDINETTSLPEDLENDLEKILSISIGNKPKSFAGTLNESGGGNRDRFIETISKGEEEVKLENNKIYALDVAKAEDAKKYTEILEIAGDPSSDVSLVGMDKPVIVVDPSSASGFRAIVIIKTCEVKVVNKKKKINIKTIGKGKEVK